MPDRVVYLVEELTAAHKEATLEFIDHERLSELLAEGYETSTTLPGMKVKAGQKSVTATMMVLKQAADNRGVSVQERSSGAGPLVSVPDGYGGERHVTLAQAMVESNRELSEAIRDQGRHVGHLGAPSRPRIPGLTVISGEVLAQMYDAGQLAQKAGKQRSDCPAPAGTSAATKWLQGYAAAEKDVGKDADPADEKRAFEDGKAMAKSLGEDDQAHNPYHSSHASLKTAWIRGFEAGGGRVEG